jgi:hypothetical protein
LGKKTPCLFGFGSGVSGLHTPGIRSLTAPTFRECGISEITPAINTVKTLMLHLIGTRDPYRDASIPYFSAAV